MTNSLILVKPNLKLKYHFSLPAIVFPYIYATLLKKAIKHTMDLRNLHYFVSVYEQKSFSAAAKKCFVAQPSISSSIAQLEQILNVLLFIRHGRGVNATSDGERLYPLAKQLLGQAQAIKMIFAEQSAKQSFYLGVTKGLGVARMSALLKDESVMLGLLLKKNLMSKKYLHLYGKKIIYWLCLTTMYYR
jgi:hypothetical protein